MRARGNFYVLIAAMLWGTTGTTQALAPLGAQPLSIGTLRLVVGGAALLTYALGKGLLRKDKHWPRRATLIAAASMAAYQLFFFAGVAKTGVAVGTIVGIGSSPIMTGILGFLIRRERPGHSWFIATALAVLGCGLLLTTGASVQIDPLGVCLAIGAGFVYAIFTITSKQLLENHSPEGVMAVTFSIGALLLLPLLFTEELSWIAQPRGLLVAIHLGLITVAIAYTLFARGLQLIPVATAATLTLAEPLTAGTLGILVLGEKLTPAAFFGILLIFSGLVLLSWQGKQSKVQSSVG